MDTMDYIEYIKQFPQCERCEKYACPPYVYKDRSITRYDYSMVCDGIPTWGPDPFAEEIHGDHSDYFMCDGERYESGKSI
ncbi:hypothetical protein SEA_ENYGMA_144 [Streptomyces phage Enygma]